MLSNWHLICCDINYLNNADTEKFVAILAGGFHVLISLEDACILRALVIQLF